MSSSKNIHVHEPTTSTSNSTQQPQLALPNMPAINISQPQASLPPLLHHWVLYTLLAILILIFIVIATVSNYRAMARRNSQSPKALFWTMDPVPASLTGRPSDSKLKPLLLGTSLPLPASARLRPNVEKESALMRGSRLSWPSPSSFGAPVLPPLAIYTLGLPSHAPAPRISVLKASQTAKAGLDTPPPTPIIPSPTCVEDLIRQRAEASIQFALPISDSVDTLFTESSASISFSSLLDAFPAPPPSINVVQPTCPSLELYPSPPATPLVPGLEFEEPTAPISLSCPMSTSDSDLLVFNRLFASSYESASDLESLAYDEPECPPHQDINAVKTPMFTVPPIPTSASFCASVEFAAAGGYLTPPASPLWF